VERKRIKLSKNMRGGGGNWDYSSGLVENDDKEVVVELILLESRVLYHFIQFGSHASRAPSKYRNVTVVTAPTVDCRIFFP